MDSTRNWKPSLIDGVRTEAVGDELIILDRSNQRVHQLNAVGASIVARCDGAHTVIQIVEALMNEYDVEMEQLNQDVRGLLTRMRDLGIVR